jgi:hypothetical protein
VGIVSVAAGMAALTVIASLCAWAMYGGEPTDASTADALYAEADAFYAESGSGTPETAAALGSFDERFASGRSTPPRGSLSVKTVVAALPITAAISVPTAPKLAEPSPGVATKPMEPRVATRSVTTPPQDPAPANPLPDDPQHAAIYDISAHKVYLPNGERLEAHSGLGEYIDDARFVHLRGRGPTPPNVYELKLRESLFHGVQAIRLNPLDGGKMYGRDGILAHSFMLDPNGQSNGCVSFKDYPAFLNAYLRGEITRLVVVHRLDDPPSPRTAGDWLSDKLKGIFGRS